MISNLNIDPEASSNDQKSIEIVRRLQMLASEFDADFCFAFLLAPDDIYCATNINDNFRALTLLNVMQSSLQARMAESN